MANICRLCLNVLSNTDQIDLNHSEVLEKLQSCFRLKISSDNALPRLICTDCTHFIDKANSFRKAVILNEEKLLENLSKDEQLMHFRFNEIKLENQELSKNISDDDNDKEIKCEDDIKDEEDSSSCIDDNSMACNVKNDNNHLGNAADNKLTKTGSSQIMYKCLTCFENYESIKVLRSHYRKIHLVKVSKKYSQYSIVNKDDGSNLFKCAICEKFYNEKKYIVRHLQSHDENRPLLCKVCGRTYKTVSEIILHNRAHSDTKLYCSYRCGFSTSYNGALKVHEKGHRKEYKYKCKKCDRGFHVKTWYLQHQNQHNGVKPYVCDVCGLSFYMDRYLQSHKNLVHMQLTKVQRYVCVHCSLPCASQYAMKKHLIEHGITSNITSSFLCDICGKTLSSAVQLKTHKITHAQVKPYSCSTCCKTFARKCNLKLHEATHSGKKRYICSHCNKPFTQKGSLRRHIARHHSSAAKKCMKCNSPSKKCMCEPNNENNK